MKVSLKGKPVTLELPKSFTLRQDISLAGVSNPHRAFAAALALCWKGKLPKPIRGIQYSRCGHNPLEYGGRVLDALYEAGYKPEEVSAAGVKAYMMVVDSQLTVPEVAEAADFTGSGEGGS